MTHLDRGIIKECSTKRQVRGLEITKMQNIGIHGTDEIQQVAHTANKSKMITQATHTIMPVVCTTSRCE